MVGTLSLDEKEPPCLNLVLPILKFRQQVIELVRYGHSAGALAKEVEPSAQTIHTWVKHTLGSAAQ